MTKTADIELDIDADGLKRLFSAADEPAEIEPEEFSRRIKEAFVEHPETENKAPEQLGKEESFGSVSWFADRAGMHFSSASRKMNGDLRIKVRDVLFLEALEREAGLR